MIHVYDASVLIAADRNDREAWAKHRARYELGIPLVPAAVVAQVSRSSKQVQLRRLLRGCQIIPFDIDDAHAAGRLLAATRTSDVVDATVVVVASARSATIVSRDVKDIERLNRAAGNRCRVVGS